MLIYPLSMESKGVDNSESNELAAGQGSGKALYQNVAMTLLVSLHTAALSPVIALDLYQLAAPPTSSPSFFHASARVMFDFSDPTLVKLLTGRAFVGCAD